MQAPSTRLQRSGKALITQASQRYVGARSRRSSAIRAAAVPKEADVIVVGAGIAGLSAAVTLKKQYGLQALVLEQGDAVGGRVRTDVVDGFLLDRGFQIFLTGYPEAQGMLDYQALELKDFYAGALVRKDGQFHRVADPFRHPVDGVASLTNPVGTVMDKVRVGLLRCAQAMQPRASQTCLVSACSCQHIVAHMMHHAA